MSTGVEQDPYAEVRAKFYKELGVGPLTSKDTSKLSEEAQKFSKEQAKTEKGKSEKDVSAAKHKVHYQDRRDRTEALIASLREYSPAANGLISKFIDTTLEADRILKSDPNAWEAANKALHKEHLKKAMGEAETLWTKAEENCRSKAKAAYNGPNGIDALREAIKTARLDLTAAELSRFADEVLQVERILLGSDLRNSAIEKAQQATVRIQQALSQARQLAQVAGEQAKTAQREAKLVVDELMATDNPGGPLATDGELAVLIRTLTDSDTALATREYASARQMLDDMKLRAEAIRDTRDRERSAWALEAGKLKTLIEGAASLANTATSPEVKAEALALGNRLEEVTEAVPGKGMTYQDAVDRVNGATTKLAELKFLQLAFAKFSSDRLKAEERIKTLGEAVEQAFNTLHGAVSEATGGEQTDTADGPFRDRLDKATEEWNARLKFAHDDVSLNEKGTRDVLTSIKDDIELAAQDGDGLAAKIDDGALRKAQQLYAAARKLAEAEVQRLFNVDATLGTTKQKELRATDARGDARTTPGAYQAAAGEMERLRLAAQQARSQKESIVQGLQMRLAQLLSPLPEQLAELLRVANEMNNATKQQPHVNMHATLTTALDTLRAMAKTSQVPLLNTTVEEAEQLAKDLAAALAVANGQDPPEGSESITFADAAKQIIKLRRDLSDKAIQTYMKISAAGVEDKIATLEKGLGSTTLSELAKSLVELRNAVTLLETQAERAKGLFERFETSAQQVRDRLDKPPFVKVGRVTNDALAPSYVAAMKARIDQLISDARFEGGMGDADIRLKRIADELDGIPAQGVDETGLPRAMVEKEAEALAAQRAKEVEKSKFEAELKVIEKQIKGLKGLYPDDLQGLEQGLKGAKSAGASGSYDDARDQLMALRNRMMLLSQNPRGLAIHVRKQLPACNARFRAAVAGLAEGIDKVGKAVAKLSENDLDANGKSAAAKALGEARALFNPTAFVKSLGALANEATEESVRAGARETALRDVRRMLAYLNEDYRLQMLAQTPFEPKMRGLISELNLALLDLENNALVSM